MAKVAVLGHGVVGSGVCEVLIDNANQIKENAKEEITIKRVLDLREFPELSYGDKFTTNFDDIINDDEISIVAEAMGGVNPAYEFTKRALESNKSVVTSNKELVAKHGAELLKIAKEHNVNYFFEASVAGAIPVIRPLNVCLAGNQINSIAGILNGTTNFILTKMITENMAFDVALKLAQDLGYAERNPSADVDGHDACRKISILSSIAWGKEVASDKVFTEGITAITLKDVEYANKWGGVIKLVGRAKKLDNDKISCMVSPVFVKNTNQLSHIDDVFNGVIINGNAVDDVMFYGRGAGKMPTASAVVGDIINIVTLGGTSKTLSYESTSENIVLEHEKTSSAFYLRIKGFDESQCKDIFGDISIIESVAAEIAFTTSVMLEADMETAIAKLNNSNILGKIRIL